MKKVRKVFLEAVSVNTYIRCNSKRLYIIKPSCRLLKHRDGRHLQQASGSAVSDKLHMFNVDAGRILQRA